MSVSTGRPASTSRSPYLRHVHDLAVARDHGQEARQLAVVDVALEVAVDARQSLRVEPRLRRFPLDVHGARSWLTRRASSASSANRTSASAAAVAM